MKFYEERYRTAISKADSITPLIDCLTRLKNDIKLNKLEIISGYKTEESIILIDSYENIEKNLSNQIDNLSNLQKQIKNRAKIIRDDEFQKYKLSIINLNT